MKPLQLYEELKNLAEKLDITVYEHNLKKAGIKVKSGLCKVKGKNIFVMDKSISVREKNRILGSCLSQMSYENIFILPFVREYLKSREDD